MKIKSLVIKNYKRFKERTCIEFEENFTSLVGKNGSGKTTVLEAINLVTSFYFVENKIKEDDFYDGNQDIEFKVEFDDFFFINIPDGWQMRKLPSKEIHFSVKHRTKSTPGKAFSDPFVTDRYAIPCEFNNRDELEIKDKQNIPKAVVKEGERFKFKRENNTEIEISDQSLVVRNNLENFPNVFYFPKNRDKDLKKGFYTTFQKIADELNWRFLKAYREETTEKENIHNGEDNQKYISMWEEFYKYIIEKVEDPKQRKIIGPLKEKLEEILGDKFNNFEISLINLKQPFESSFFSIRRGDQIIGLSNLASGELMVLAYYFLRLTSELSKEDVIFLIDDIELHLHPQLQRKLFEELKNSKFQHIFTTHSDIFVDIENWRSIKRFTEDKIYPDKENLSREYKKDRASETRQTLEQHLDDIKTYCQGKTIFCRENNEILFDNRCILVEGPNDKYGLLAIDKKFNEDNFLKRFTILYCRGKGNIPYYQMLCMAFGIQFFAIYDFDKGTGDEGKDEMIKEFCNGTNNIFSFETSFEEIIESERLHEILNKIDQVPDIKIPIKINDCLSKIKSYYGV